MKRYLEFRALGNTVICTCASVPDWIAEDVAQEIARLLSEAQSVLPYRDIAEQIEGERHD